MYDRPNMRRTLLLLVTAAGIAAAQQVVQFKDHVIEANAKGGYAVIVTDINKDGKPDVIGISQQLPDLTWYENPTWQPHVIVKDLLGQVNLAAYDIDGDGIPEIALESGFAMQQAKSPGLVWLVQHVGDPREPWKSTKLDAFPTSHHIAWADVDGDGKKELINAPLVGDTNAAPKYEGKTPLFFYHVPKDWSSDWKRQTVDDNISGITHRIRVVNWTGKGKQEQLLAATFEGVVLYSASGKGDNLKWNKKVIVPGHNTEEAPRLGASDVKIAHLGKHRILATVEPWHGNEVVVYTAPKGGSGLWDRHVLDDSLHEGHGLWCADFDGDGVDEIVAGCRAAKPTVNIYKLAGSDPGKWDKHILDDGGMAEEDLNVADLNGDGKLDIVAVGRATHNVRIYWNE